MSTTLKILGQVSCCGECTNHVYDSGGLYECRLVGETVRDKTVVAPFCPLLDYPSRTIAGMEMTIIGLREGHEHSFDLTLLTHVATKLRLSLHPNGLGITIPFMEAGEAREVYLGLDYIREIQVRPFMITFLDKNKWHELYPDNSPPLLREEVDRKQRHWVEHVLSV